MTGCVHRPCGQPLDLKAGDTDTNHCCSCSDGRSLLHDLVCPGKGNLLGVRPDEAIEALVHDEDAVAKFRSKVGTSSASDGCHVWGGTLRPDGYGNHFYRRQKLFAHRISYRLHSGPLVSGLSIDHLCRNTSCVNPAHLEQVMPAVNTLRGHGFSGINARKTHCIRGHPLSGDNLYVTPKNGYRQCRICQAMRAAKVQARRYQGGRKR